MEGEKKYCFRFSLLSVAIFMNVAPSCLLLANAQLSQNYYASSCPNVESLVRGAVSLKLQQSMTAGPGTLRLFFHDCFVRGCDASLLLTSPTGDDESHSGADLTLAPDAVDTINKAKQAVEAQCANKVSCADILALAARDVVSLSGGPNYAVELGRLDGKLSTRANVKHNLPGPGFNLDQLNEVFSANGLTQTDMIALSGAHTIGVSHCDKFIRRIYQFKEPMPYNPPMNLTFLRELRQTCTIDSQKSAYVHLDPVTPSKFDNTYYQNLQRQMGLLASDQVLFADRRSRGTVDLFATNETAFEEAFVAAIMKLGRVGIKTGSDGEIRRVCTAAN